MSPIARLTWTKRPNFEAGVDRGVFYPLSGPGVAWNGLTAIRELPQDTAAQAGYIDGVKTHIRLPRGSFSGVIEAFTYPDAFYDDILTQRRAKNFGLSYRTLVENNYRIHLVYNVLVVPASHAYRQEAPDIFKWNFTTLPVEIPGLVRSAHLIVDGLDAYPWVVAELEGILYGTSITEPRLPLPTEIVAIFEENSLLIVTDHGDGTFTIDGPDEAITMLSADTFEVTWPSVTIIDADTYQISTL